MAANYFYIYFGAFMILMYLAFFDALSKLERIAFVVLIAAFFLSGLGYDYIQQCQANCKEKDEKRATLVEKIELYGKKLSALKEKFNEFIAIINPNPNAPQNAVPLNPVVNNNPPNHHAVGGGRGGRGH